MTRRTLWGLRLRKTQKLDKPKPDAPPTPAPPSGEPPLWIISAGEPEGTLSEFGFEPDPSWPSGVHKLQEALGVYMVVVSGLPRRQDTLLLRLMGKGPTLQRAIEDLDALPLNHRLRALAAQIIGLFHLDKRRKRRRDDKEDLYMQITDPVYIQFVQEQQRIGWLAGEAKGEAKGRSEGQRVALARYLTKRFGGSQEAWRASLEQIQSADALETLSDAIYDATTQEAALEAIAQAKA
jgi:hypothetical protein